MAVEAEEKGRPRWLVRRYSKIQCRKLMSILLKVPEISLQKKCASAAGSFTISERSDLCLYYK
jgi:hypothetical protein